MEYSEIVELIQKVVFQNERCDHKEKLWASIDARCITDKPNTRISFGRRTLLWRIAASIIIIVSVTLGIQTARQSFTASDGDLAVTLPDNSQVTLYAGSVLKYNNILWLFRHNVSLSGKALFDGEHDNKFKVKTSQGDISVLGTEFLVAEQTNSLQVACFSGSVSVTTPLGMQILKEGEQVFCDESGMQFSKIEKELPEYIIFEDGPIEGAIRQIEEIYDVHIEGINKYIEYTYSGVIPTRNLEEALELVLRSCNIGYSITGNDISIH